MRREYRTTQEMPTRRWIPHPYKQGVLLPVHRRPMRMPGVDYTAVSCLCFVTYCLSEREPLLTGATGSIAWQAIFEQRDQAGFTLHTACLMPDHVHLLISPSGTGESISDIIRGLKLCQTHRVRAETGLWLRWQSSFYDHVLGKLDASEEERDTIRVYIRQNPVRANLTTVWSKYPFVYDQSP